MIRCGQGIFCAVRLGVLHGGLVDWDGFDEFAGDGGGLVGIESCSGYFGVGIGHEDELAAGTSRSDGVVLCSMAVVRSSSIGWSGLWRLEWLRQRPVADCEGRPQ